MMRAQATIAEERGACALYLSPGISVSQDDIETGFRWLKSWDVLMPLLSYEKLAEEFGSTEELLYTGSIVKDLRQMVYDERVLFVRRGSSADELLSARNEETCEDVDCPLPMLRAVWRVKPLLLALPTVWVQEETA